MIMAASYMLTMFPLIYMTTGGGPGTNLQPFAVLVPKAMIENNYGYANAVGVVVIIMGMVCMNLIKWMMGERGTDRHERYGRNTSLKATTQRKDYRGQSIRLLGDGVHGGRMLVPIVWIILSSFKTNAEVFKGAFFPDK